MKIGIPKEIKPQESRIGLTPESVKYLTKIGHEVLVKKMVVSKQVLMINNIKMLVLN